MTPTLSSLPPRERVVVERRSRDRRIRELAERGWTERQIAADVGVTRQRVNQILASVPSREEVISATIRELVLELAHISGATERDVSVAVAHLTLSARAKALRRQLERLEEELEAHRIDRLLGLA